jgi:hypothetical protein
LKNNAASQSVDWDRKLEEDAAAGRLDVLAAEVENGA